MRNLGECRQKWECRYRDRKDPQAPAPCRLLADFWCLLPSSGDALDLACGLGGNALLLARRGLRTSACDLSQTAIHQLQERMATEGLSIHAQACDVTDMLGEARRYDVITVSFYLDRGIIPLMQRAMRPGGLIYYQTFTRAASRGPTNIAYRLGNGELLHFFQRPQWALIHYREEENLPGCTDPDLHGQACLIARKEPRDPGEGKQRL